MAATAKQMRESFAGAVAAALQGLASGALQCAPDMLQVSPLSAADATYDWVQPKMGSGGHIIGLEADPTMTLDRAIVEGAQAIQLLVESGAVAKQTNSPNHALPVLAALAFALDDHETALPAIGQYIGFAQTPEVFVPGEQNDIATFSDRAPFAKARDFLQTHNWVEEPPKGWKVIKKLMPAISNKTARYIFRQITITWPHKKKALALFRLRQDCMEPPEVGAHPVERFVTNCYMMRPSSISCSLPRKVPDLAKALLKRSGMIATGQAPPADELRTIVLRKFTSFYQWKEQQFGSESTPVTWSDTLSRFAKAVNPALKQHNEQVGHDPAKVLLEATSFVAADLAGEMYARDRCQTYDIGYFIMGQGMCYAYSNAWRRDAFIALYHRRLPAAVKGKLSKSPEELQKHITPEIAFEGKERLVAAIDAAGISKLEFCNFLRAYYFSGAFLTINLNMETA